MGWWLPEARGGGWAKWDRGSKVQTFSYKINKSWGCNIQHGNHSLKHCIGYLKISKRDLKSFHQQKKIFVTMYGDRC